MLVELTVENYAVIERAHVEFRSGLNLLTGETGSGKSIVVDALGLLYGGRASADLIRSGAARARVSGIFEAPVAPAFRALMEQNAIEIEDGELLVEREIHAGGKSRAFLGGRPVTTALLRELAPHLGDIHGQHDQQELFSPETQLDMVDTYGGVSEAVGKVGVIYRDWRSASTELEQLDRGEQESLRLADLWSFQCKEIEEAALKPGDDERLEAERRILSNVSRLEENATGAYQALYDAPASALSLLRQARRRLEELCRLDETLRPALDLLIPAEASVEESARDLQHYLGKLEADPARLDWIESRLEALDKLKRKYGTTLTEILTYFEEVAAKLAAVQSAGTKREELLARKQKLAADYEAAAAQLSRMRHETAIALEKQTCQELAALAMEGTVFRVEFATADWSAHGTDKVRFLVSANAGEEPKPIEKIASGGELSRLALALKTCLTSKAASTNKPGRVRRTLVFDEVDAGIGGRTAETVGRRLKKLAATYQLLCVTHLPQIAGFADQHYLVQKKESKGRTVAVVEEIKGDERTREIGRMLSGSTTTPEALKNAEQLIKLAAG
jgi:DNA repair protein RecN (Recombination protein N)